MTTESHSGWIVSLGAMRRIVIAAAAALAALALGLVAPIKVAATALITWDVGALTYLGLAWWLILCATPEETRDYTRRQDPRAKVIVLLLVIAACFSIVALGWVVGTLRPIEGWHKWLGLILAVTALVASWFLIHTVFAIHYAHVYYEHDPKRASPADAGGLKFPKDRTPDYLDFAYYSFVVGMTSQVSDVQVESRAMRRLTLGHGILSFIFNIAVLALAMNIIAGAIFEKAA